MHYGKVLGSSIRIISFLLSSPLPPLPPSLPPPPGKMEKKIGSIIKIVLAFQYTLFLQKAKNGTIINRLLTL